MMPLSSNIQDAQRERRAHRTEAVGPQRHTTEQPTLLGQPRATGLPLNQLLTGSTEQLRDRITNYDDPVHRLIDQPHLILRLLVTWPGHSRPEIEASKRLQSGGCNCLGRLAVEVAKECQDILQGWEKNVEPSIATKKVLEIENLRLIALHYVEEPDGHGAYHAFVESVVRE